MASLMSWLALPARFLAVQVYRPASLLWVDVIAKVPLAKIRICAPSITGLLSFSQATSGCGCPSATHSRLTGCPSTEVYSIRGTLSTGGTGRTNKKWKHISYSIVPRFGTLSMYGGLRIQKGNVENRHAGAVMTHVFLISLFQSTYIWNWHTFPIFSQIESSHYLVAPVWSCPQPLQLHSSPGTGTSPHHQVWRGKISELRLRAQTVCDLNQITWHESDIGSYKHRLSNWFQTVDDFETVPG